MKSVPGLADDLQWPWPAEACPFAMPRWGLAPEGMIGFRADRVMRTGRPARAALQDRAPVTGIRAQSLGSCKNWKITIAAAEPPMLAAKSFYFVEASEPPPEFGKRRAARSRFSSDGN